MGLPPGRGKGCSISWRASTTESKAVSARTAPGANARTTTPVRSGRRRQPPLLSRPAAHDDGARARLDGAVATGLADRPARGVWWDLAEVEAAGVEPAPPQNAKWLTARNFSS